MGSAFRPILAWLGVVAVIASAGVGSNLFSVRDRIFGSAVPERVAPASSRAVAAPGSVPSAPTALRSAPWWQAVATFSGDGATTSPPFTIAEGATQWRVTWSCPSGRLLVRAAGQADPLIDAACSETTTGYARRTGATSLVVTADGPWRLDVAQQIDRPLVEPRLPMMSAAGTTTLSAGSFYKVDETGTGKVTVFDQADGGYSVRLDDFFVTPNTHLQLRFSTAEEPRTSAEYLAGRSQLLTVMDVTAGSLNYPLPLGVEPGQFRSVVIWCPPTNSAYAAASLKVS